jgi:hypothetical protein
LIVQQKILAGKKGVRRHRTAMEKHYLLKELKEIIFQKIPKFFLTLTLQPIKF